MASESSLSPPPEDLQAQAEAGDFQSSMNGSINDKKRKAEATTKVTKQVVTKRTRKTLVKGVVDADGEVSDQDAAKPAKRSRKVNVEEPVEDKVQIQEDQNGATVKTKQQKTVTRKKKDEVTSPLAERTTDTKLLLGAHVSTAKGIHNAVGNALHIGANAFALFLRNQRTWNNGPMKDEHVNLFIDGCKDHNFETSDCCVPHGSYLVNLAHPDEARKKQAYDVFLDDLKRCHRVGIKLYNFHPGNANATTRENGIQLIADAINKAHADPATGAVVPLLETMASFGNTIGGHFKDIADIIKLVEDKDRIGVCLDTCHVFAAGYDLRTPAAYADTMQEFDDVIGLKYLKALHMNDSKAPFDSRRDLHARIGTGYLGLRAFHNLVNDERLHGLPMVLETPVDSTDANGKKVEDKGVWAREIKMLEQLVGMDVKSAQFKKWEADLHREGTNERERIGDQVARKAAKEAPPKKAKGKKKVESDIEEDEDDE